MITFANVAPREVGIPDETIQKLIARLARRQIPMHSLLILRHDKLAFEGYYAPVQQNPLPRLFSVTKSLTAVCIGLLEEEGKLKLSDRIVDYFPDKIPLDPDPEIGKMTIRDMLMMRTCHASTTYKIDMKTDWVQSFFSVKSTHPAGTLFHYDTSSAHVLAALVERLSGMEMMAYVRKKLEPVGFSRKDTILRDPFDSPIGGSGWVGTSEDLLRFGHFLLRKGNVGGEQLLSEDFLNTALSLQSSTMATAQVPGEACGYGYMFWISESGTPFCYGLGGQYIFLYPELDLVVVTTADDIGLGGGNQQIYDAVREELIEPLQRLQEKEKPDEQGWRHLIGVASGTGEADSGKPILGASAEASSAKGGRPLKSAPADMKKLAQSLTLLTPIGDAGSSLMSMTQTHLQKKTFRFDPNPMGFTDMQLSWVKDVGTLHYTLKGQKCDLSFGMGRHVTKYFPGYNQFYAGDGIWLADGSLYLYFHIIDAYVGNVRMQFSFDENRVTVFLKKNEESLFAEYQGHLVGWC